MKNQFFQKLRQAILFPNLTYYVGRDIISSITTRLSYYFLNGISPLPRQISIEPTNSCNLKCLMCGRWQQEFRSRDSSELKVSSYLPFLKEIAKFKPRISLTGAEPLLYKDIFSLIEEIKKLNLCCSLATNGTKLTEFSSEILKSGLDVLNISIDGPEEVHNYIRGKDVYQRVIAGIKILDSLKKKRGKRTPLIQVIFVISDINYQYLFKTVEILSQLNINIDYFRFQHLWYATEDMLEEHNSLVPTDLRVNLTKEEIIKIMPQIDRSKIDAEKLYAEIEKIKKSKFPFPISFFPELSLSSLNIYYQKPLTPLANVCLDPYFHTVITNNGSVSPCLDYVSGNIKEESFYKIWNGERYQYFRQNLKRFGGSFPYCRRCCGIFSHKGLP